MWARFTVLRDTPIDSAIAGCVIPFSRSNTIWMRWRCWGCPFQRSAVFKRRISFLVHLTTCSSESNQIRWSVRIILRLTNAIHIRIRCFATINIRFNQLWKRYENRAKYNRDHLRYPSDLTDDEWAHVEPLIPPAKPGGGKRRTEMRAVMNGVMYILSTGCQWRYLPKDFPPRSTVHNYFVWWQCDRVLDRIHHALYVECRERAEREASPTAAIIDSQSVKSAEKGGLASIRTGSMPAS